MTKFASLKKKVEKLSKMLAPPPGVQQLSDAELELLLKGLTILQSGVAHIRARCGDHCPGGAGRIIPCREC
jgi:hypothetical protein